MIDALSYCCCFFSSIANCIRTSMPKTDNSFATYTSMMRVTKNGRPFAKVKSYHMLHDFWDKQG